MPVPDARTRSKIALNPKVLSASSKVLPRTLVTNALFAVALHVGKEWLLIHDVGVFWVVMRVLACAGLAVIAWEAKTGQLAKRQGIEWSALGAASLLLFIQQACLFTALFRLSSIRVVLFTQFSALWVDSVLTTQFSRKTLAIVVAFTVSALSDTGMASVNVWRLLPGYAALVLHGLSSAALDHTLGVVAPSLGATFTIGASILGASVFALPFYIFRSFMVTTSTGYLPLMSLAAIPFLSYILLWLQPTTTRTLAQFSHVPQHIVLSYPFTFVVASVLGPLAFSQTPSWTDLFVASFLYVGMYPQRREASISIAPRTPTSRLVRSYLKTILSNSESRKIFYFLMLNMAYMLVQMLYGVWTNSLGLISDAIHMAFDCMAIGVGLFASVMATWEPNERFTYGYGRIETLSGFANGIFLILISIFIVFEAIQRILEPPEMNTSQLLLVSSLGLAVNLFGMFAMGGHHHHGGHSHSHGHSHGPSTHSTHDHDHSGHSHSSPTSAHSHSHSPTPSPSTILNFAQDAHNHLEENHLHSHSSHEAESNHSHSHSDHGHSHSDDHSHSHSDHGHANAHVEDHSHSHSPPTSAVHSHSHSAAHVHAEESHSHSHAPEANSHSHSDDCGHEHDHDHDHGHSHSETNALANGHGHGHSHSPSASPVHDHTSESLPAHSKKPKRQFLGTELKIAPLDTNGVLSAVGSHVRSLDDHVPSPITPTYAFVNDDHLQTHTPPVSHHEHSHEGHSDNMRGVFLHVMADTLGSVGVIVSTLLIQFYGWTGFDPIASLFIAILIAASVVPLVLDTGRVLCLDLDDRDVKIERALAELSSVEGLASYSQARFWPKDSSTVIGSIHIQLASSAASVDPGGPHGVGKMSYARADRVIERVDAVLRQRIGGLEELTIQAGSKIYFKTSVH